MTVFTGSYPFFKEKRQKQTNKQIKTKNKKKRKGTGQTGEKICHEILEEITCLK